MILPACCQPPMIWWVDATHTNPLLLNNSPINFTLFLCFPAASFCSFPRCERSSGPSSSSYRKMKNGSKKRSYKSPGWNGRLARYTNDVIPNRSSWRVIFRVGFPWDMLLLVSMTPRRTCDLPVSNICPFLASLLQQRAPAASIDAMQQSGTISVLSAVFTLKLNGFEKFY